MRKLIINLDNVFNIIKPNCKIDPLVKLIKLSKYKVILIMIEFAKTLLELIIILIELDPM
jgi:hypothetical protein